MLIKNDRQTRATIVIELESKKEISAIRHMSGWDSSIPALVYDEHKEIVKKFLNELRSVL